MEVLTWNLKHGRAVPSAGHELLAEFAGALSGWAWDVALLQEVPPWWPGPLARATGAAERHVLTSRNALLAVRRAIAVRWPDVIKSNGGGANAILVRDGAAVGGAAVGGAAVGGGVLRDHRIRRLSLLPERRWVHAVELDGMWVANLHTEGRLDQVQRAAAVAANWAGERPLVLGGDFNLRDLRLDDFQHAGGHTVDHVFVRGGLRGSLTEVIDRGRLSDHAPVLVSVRSAHPPEI